MLDYEEMSSEELQAEMQRLLQEMRKKQQAGLISEANILEQKYYFARSYTMDLADIQSNQQYRVVGEAEPFRVQYLNSMMAWGCFPSSTEDEAVPIGKLDGLYR